MPMITVKILEGHSDESKRRMAAGIQKAVLDNTHMQLSSSDVWIVFEDVPEKQWFWGDFNE